MSDRYDDRRRDYDDDRDSRRRERDDRHDDRGRGPPRDYDRGPPPRDYDRAPPRDYDRGPPRGYDRGPPPRDMDRGYRGGYDRGGYGGGRGGYGGGRGGYGGGGGPPPMERDLFNDFDMHRRGRAYDEMSKRDMPEDYVGRDRLNLEDNEVAFVLGRGGSTKTKIARAANCRLDMDDAGHLEFSGPADNCARAREYVELVLAQRKGPVFIDFSVQRPDLTAVDVPEECVGFVTGRGGTVLRGLEEEWGTLMFFAKDKSANGSPDMEKLAIFGTPRSRCGAELKVLSAVEFKNPGFFLEGDRPRTEMTWYDNFDDTDFGVDTFIMRDDEYSYALGKRGSTRKKLARAACCIVEYIGTTAFMAGSRSERACAKDYLKWLIAQRDGPVTVDRSGRDDVTAVEVPSSCVGYITGSKGSSLRQIEMDTGTFCFADGDKNDNADTENILVFCCDEERRLQAEEIIKERVRQKMDNAAGGGGGYGGGGYGGGGYGGGGYGRGGGGGGGRYDDRDRYDRPPRRDDRRRDRSPMRRSRSPY